jgi:Domain of unknown function (DUF4159)
MDLFVNCPKCGKQLTYGPMNAGAVWLCPACGARVQLPAPPPPPPPPPPLPEPEILEEDPAAVQPGNPLVPWLIAAGATILVLGITILWLSLRTGPSWEQIHRQEILDLKTEAEGLAARGMYRAAYDRLQDLEDLVAGNSITDPELKAALEQAREEQNDLVDRMLKQELALAPHPPPATQRAAPPPATEPVFVAAPPPAPRRPRVSPLPPPPPVNASNGFALVDDDRIGRTIERGVDYLIKQFVQTGVLNGIGASSDDEDALVVYALLQAYHATGDGRLDPKRNFMKLALDTLKRLPMNDYQSTYGRSLRANALELAGRKEDLDALRGDLRWLLVTGPDGAYTYPPRLGDRMDIPVGNMWDNSNSQYGLLGVWAAAEAGLNVPRNYWLAARNHWQSTQLPNGEWAYNYGDQSPRKSMTLAGLASLMVTQDYLEDNKAAETVGLDPFPPALAAALNWLETDNNAVIPFHEGMTTGYALYGLERVGLASGFKFFGAHDWYREAAAEVVADANPDGGWGGEVETSFALLFLARGRHPIVMNKLRFDGAWDNRPRDVSNLTRYIGRTVEHQLNWQIVPIDHDWTDWTDGPIIYLASHQPPNLTADEEEKLRQFVLNGGMLLTQADGGSDSFTQWATALGLRLFPSYQWQTLPADHPLWSVALRVKSPPRMQAITNGARILMIHLSDDVSHFWQARAEVDHHDEFALGLNIFLYASGRSELRNRLATTVIPDPPGTPAATINLLQLKIGDESDAEPDAWPRFVKWFRWQTDLGVNLVPRRMEDLLADTAPIAHFTGVHGFKATDLQCDALRHYVQDGGVVLIDPCGGPNDFLQSVREDLLPRAFPKADLDRLESNHPLLTSSADGMSQLWPLEVRDYVRGLDPPVERGVWILRSGKGAVILSSLDITSGLLGTNTWGITGFTPDYSLALAKNFVLWAWDGAQD